MQEQKSSTFMWWIGGFIVVLLSGVGAYLYASRGASTTPIETVSNKSNKSDASKTGTKSSRESESTSSGTASTGTVTATDLGTSTATLEAELEQVDETLANFEAVDTNESAPSL